MAQPGGSAPPTLTISPEVALGHPANFVGIFHSYFEVILDFGRTLPNRTDIPIVTRVTMHPFHAKQLLRALAHNLQQYERQFGTIPDAVTPQPTPPPAGGESN